MLKFIIRILVDKYALLWLLYSLISNSFKISSHLNFILYDMKVTNLQFILQTGNQLFITNK